MALPASTTRHLTRLAEAAGGTFRLAADLDELLMLAAAAVPSCLAASVTVTPGGLPVTVTALTPAALLDPVRASLALRLPRPSPAADTALLVLYAGDPGAWAQPAADLVALLDLDPRRATVDGHLELPPLAVADDDDDLAYQLDDVSAVDRAVGVLLDRGLLPADGRRELHRLAAAVGTGVATAARTLLAGIPPPTVGR